MDELKIKDTLTTLIAMSIASIDVLKIEDYDAYLEEKEMLDHIRGELESLSPFIDEMND